MKGNVDMPVHTCELRILSIAKPMQNTNEVNRKLSA